MYYMTFNLLISFEKYKTIGSKESKNKIGNKKEFVEIVGILFKLVYLIILKGLRLKLKINITISLSVLEKNSVIIVQRPLCFKRSNL